MIGLTISKYRLLEEIGRGAMGIVFKAQDMALGGFESGNRRGRLLANSVRPCSAVRFFPSRSS